MSAAGRHPVVKAGPRPFSRRARDRRCLIAPMRQGTSHCAARYGVARFSLVYLVPGHRLTQCRLYLYSVGFEYSAPTASVLDSVDTGCQASTACFHHPTAVAYTLRTICLLYTCIDVEDRRRGQKALWLCACMQARDVVLSGTAGAHCRRKLSGTEHAYRIHPVDTRGAMCLR